MPGESTSISLWTPKSTSSYAASSKSIVITASAPSSASAGVAAAIAPSRMSGLVRSSLRFHTDNSCPAISNRSAIGVPILPSPKNPTFITIPLGRTALLDDKLRSVKTTELLRFDGVVERDPAIDAWMAAHAGELGAIALYWFEVMRKCGDEVRELLHDGCPVACLGNAPFGYVNVFTSHVRSGFFHGAALRDPARLLQGAGKFMRHVKLRPGTATNAAELGRLIDAAYADIKARVENG